MIKTRIGGLSLCLIIFLISCSEQSRYSGKKIFRYNESANINSLDPAFAKQQSNIWAVNQLFNGLVQMNEELEVEPCIAKRWEVSDSGKTYTFTLRSDVEFHRNACFKNGGRKVTAQDFEYSFLRLIDPKVAAPGAWVFSKVDNFKAINDSTLEIRLKYAFQPFLGLLSMKYCSVVPHEAIALYKDEFSRNPVGTGPFLFKTWVENEKLVVLKNDHYFEFDKERGDLPKLDAVAVSFIPDKQSAFLEFSKGHLDFLSALDASYKDELLDGNGVLREKYADRMEMSRLPFLNTEYLGINMKTGHEALKSKAFRQALNYGFDRREMMAYLRNNIGTPAEKGVIPLGLPSYQDQANYGYQYDPEKARALLRSSGLDVDNLTPIVLTTTSNYRDLCEYVQGSWQKLGLNVEVNVVPDAHLRELKAKGEADFFRASWIADYPDGENYLSMFYSKNFTPSGPNYTFYKDDQFDSAYVASNSFVAPKDRWASYQFCDSLLMDQSPVVPLFYDQVVRFYHKHVSGLKGDALNSLDLRKVDKLAE